VSVDRLRAVLREIRSSKTGEVSSYAARVTCKGRRVYVALNATERRWAEAEMARIVEEIRRDVWIEPLPRRRQHKMPTFAAFATEWVERRVIEGGRRATGLAPASEAELRWELGHLLSYFGPLPVDQIAIADVDSYRLAKVTEARLASSSINKTISTLASVLETALEHDLLDRNPARGRRRRPPKAVRARPFISRADHIRAILDAAAALDREARVSYGERRAIIATLIFAGVRIGEARRLRWEDVDLAGATIDIRAAKTPAGVRVIDLLPVLRDELQRFRRSQDLPAGLLFATRTGGPIDASNVRQRVLAAAVDRADLALRRKGLPPLPPGLTPHAMRRTFASLLFALGESPPYVMHQMGHTTAAFTLALYAKAMDRREGERAKLVALANGRSTRSEPTGSATRPATVTFRTPWRS
jgi:integrase